MRGLTAQFVLFKFSHVDLIQILNLRSLSERNRERERGGEKIVRASDIGVIYLTHSEAKV